jgi:hypothetical protein
VEEIGNSYKKCPNYLKIRRQLGDLAVRKKDIKIYFIEAGQEDVYYIQPT